jgi:hypothetical protein
MFLSPPWWFFSRYVFQRSVYLVGHGRMPYSGGKNQCLRPPFTKIFGSSGAGEEFVINKEL